MRTGDASPELLQEIRSVLESAFEGGFTGDDWDHTLGGWHVVVTDTDEVVSHAAVVARILEFDGRTLSTGYVEGVGTRPDRQGEGLGTLAMELIATLIQEHFEVGALSTGDPGFYERLGWERWRGPSFVRRGSELLRTEDEDAGLMVLRFGGSEAVDIGGSITCEDRPGDAW